LFPGWGKLLKNWVKNWELMDNYMLGQPLTSWRQRLGLTCASWFAPKKRVRN
jgi:hypothetical protein